MSVFATYGVLAGSGKLDADVAAFLTATGIADATIRNALNTFVKGLKSNGLWTKAKAIYPVVGGSAATHKYNLKDPRDLDAAYRITFNGTIIHSAAGVQGDGATGYFNTHLNPTTALAQDSASIFINSNTNTATAGGDFGSYQAAGSVGLYIINRNAINGTQTRCNAAALDNIASSVTDSRGFWGVSRTLSANFLGVTPSTINTLTRTSAGLPNLDMYGMCLNQAGVATGFQSEGYNFFWAGDGLSSSECSTLRTLVNTLQSNLGR